MENVGNVYPDTAQQVMTAEDVLEIACFHVLHVWMGKLLFVLHAFWDLF
jgi:hypothetical protein